ncbi:MAG: hypothetical protein ABEI86_08835 [Halobacteriaceae archaeon]
MGLDLDPPRPEEYLVHLCSNLGVPENIESASREVLDECSPGSGNPIGIAGAGIYQACRREGEEITLRRIASVTGITKETIWRQVNNMDGN